MSKSFRTLRSVLVLVPVFALGCASGSEQSVAHDSEWKGALAKQPTNALDGARFEVQLVEAGKSGEGDPDVLEFAGGRFHSTACDAYGFGSGVCTVTETGETIEFTSLCTNPAGDRNEWHGIVRGDAIEGAFTWTPAQGEAKTSTFSGTRKP